MLGTIPTETLLQAYEYQKANDEEKKQIIDKAIERKRLKKKRLEERNYLRDVICYPYTFPFGIINEYIYTLPFCYTSVGRDISLSEKRKKGKKRSQKNDDPNYHKEFDTTQDEIHKRRDIRSGVKMDILINEVSNLMKNNVQLAHIEQIAGQYANVTNEWFDTSKDDKYGNKLSSEEYEKKINKLKTQKSINQNFPIINDLMKWESLPEDHEYKKIRSFYNKNTKEIEYVKPYFCKTNIDQTVNETIEQISEVNDDIKEKVVNKIKGHIKDHLNEMGIDEVPLRSSVSSMDKIHNELKNNITETIHQTTKQISKISSNLNYIDRYGYCDIEKDIHNSNYGKSKGKIIKQESELLTLSKNIINNSIDIIMKNDLSIEINNTTTINRVENSVIVMSFIFDIICFGLCVYLIKNFITKENCDHLINKLYEEFEKYFPKDGIETLLKEHKCNYDKVFKILKDNL